MGCSDSKLDSLPTVSLLRSRSDLLSSSLRHRSLLASSHHSYHHSLLSLSHSLHRLLLLDINSNHNSHPLPLPSPRKPDPVQSHSRTPSASGSHIQFHPSDSDSDTASSSSSPLHHIHYARGQPPPPTVSFAPAPQTAQFTSADTSYHNNAYSDFNPLYEQYSYTGGYFGTGEPPPPPAAAAPYTGGYFGTGERPPPPAAAAPRPPPPPSPPRTSAWEFLNPFEYEAYYPSYPASRSSREVRDEEGIPELEELDEVVKEVYTDQKPATSTSAGDSAADGGLHYRSRSAGGTSTSEEEEGSVVEKSVAHEEARSVPAVVRRYANSPAAVDVIKAEFVRAAEAAAEVSRLLEVGNRSLLKGSKSKAADSVMPSSSNYGEISNFDEDMSMNTKSLSSTLQKLYLWEKKLCEEVRAEEKMRLLHDKNCKRLKHLDEKGAEAHKIDSTQTLVRKLSIKIRISIKVVDSISNKITKLRDEELCPQINELILGFMRMWNIMLECHRNQCQAITEATNLDFISNTVKPTDSHIIAIMELELVLLRWIADFSDWINAQKSFVKAVNGWLVLCLHYQPEVTADGIMPYSPGRIGAPPIFVICNYWSQAMERVSEKEVVDTLQSFAAKVRLLLEQSNADQQQKMITSKDMERWLKTRVREQQTIHKELDALNKKLVLVPGQNSLPLYPQPRYHDNSAEVGSLQLGLKQIFEAMEKFTASFVKAYEEMRSSSEGERLARENVRAT